MYLELGSIYEKEGRLEDAERAYEKALEYGNADQRKVARLTLEQVVSKRNSFYEKHLVHVGEKLWDSVVAILSTILGSFFVAMMLWWPVRKLAEWWTTNRLGILPFGESNLNFVETLRMAVEQVREHYKPRDRILHVPGTGPLIYVDWPSAPDLANLTTEIVPGAGGRLLGLVLQKSLTPEYTIRGAVGTNQTSCSISATLQRRGDTIRVWDEAFQINNAIEGAKTLALRIAHELKEHLEHANGNK